MTEAEQNIATLLSEDGSSSPREAFRAQRGRPGPVDLRARRGRPRGVLGRAGRAPGLVQALGHGDGLDPAVGASGSWAGTLNASYNCLDRHVEAGGGDKVAYHWEGEPGDSARSPTRSCYEEVCRFANALQVARRRQGRPRRDLPRHGARAARRDARVRADRRAALGRVRRVLAPRR